MKILLDHEGRDTIKYSQRTWWQTWYFDVPLPKLMFAKAAHDILITATIVKAAMHGPYYEVRVSLWSQMR